MPIAALEISTIEKVHCTERTDSNQKRKCSKEISDQSPIENNALQTFERSSTADNNKDKGAVMEENIADKGEKYHNKLLHRKRKRIL